MSLLFGIKKCLIRTFIVLIGFLCSTIPSISISANPINYEQEYRSYSSVGLKITEEISLPTKQNLKDAITTGQFLGVEYANCVDAERNAAKTGVQYTKSSLSLGRQMHTATGIVLTVVGGKIESAVVKGIEKAVVKYEVGAADALAKKSVSGDALDIHHVPQSQPAGQIIKGYDKKTAPAIALSPAEHKAIPTLRGSATAGNARQQLAKDIRDLRNQSLLIQNSGSKKLFCTLKKNSENLISYEFNRQALPNGI